MIEDLLERKNSLEQARINGESVSELRFMIIYKSLYEYYLNEGDNILAEEYRKKFQEHEQKVEEIQKNLGYF